MRLSRGFYPIVALVPTVPNSAKRGGKRGKGPRKGSTGKGVGKSQPRRFVRARRSFSGGKSQAPGFRPTVNRTRSKGSKSKGKTSRPVEKLPEKDQKTVLFSVHVVVKKAILLLIARFQAMTGRDKEKI